MEFIEENKDLVERLANIDLNLVQKIIQERLSELFMPTITPDKNFKPRKEFE